MLNTSSSGANISLIDCWGQSGVHSPVRACKGRVLTNGHNLDGYIDHGLCSLHRKAKVDPEIKGLFKHPMWKPEISVNDAI